MLKVFLAQGRKKIHVCFEIGRQPADVERSRPAKYMLHGCLPIFIKAATYLSDPEFDIPRHYFLIPADIVFPRHGKHHL